MVEIKDYRKEAHHLVGLGISVIPLRKDGSKKPAIKWGEFQTRHMTHREVEKHFKETTGIIALTGPISNLLCIDFDLDKSLPGQDYWGDFIDGLPEQLHQKLLINKTRSGGRHIWIRTDWDKPSKKVARRYLTIPELMDKYEEALNYSEDVGKISETLLRKPLECVIETRGKGGYGVLMHKDYERLQGSKIPNLSREETEELVYKCYSLDCGFLSRKPRKYDGGEDYAFIRNYNEQTPPQDVVDLIESTGIYKLHGEDSYGNFLMHRVGSKNPYSAKVFRDTGIFTTFSMDTLFLEDRTGHTPFSVYCTVHNLTAQEAIKNIRNGIK